MCQKSGLNWVTWANCYAKNSVSLVELASPFREGTELFIEALTFSGAEVEIKATKIDEVRAYLLRWSWLISEGRCLPEDAPAFPEVKIEWDHGNLSDSQRGAREMVNGFGIRICSNSANPPSIKTNHLEGKAIEMHISWKKSISILKKDGNEMTVNYLPNPNENKLLHEVGASYGVFKSDQDPFYWSIDGL